jgi:hypothetical protein
MSNAILYRMPFGVPGDISRAFGQATVEPQAFDPTKPFGAFGLPGKMSGGLFVPLSVVGDTQAYGWLVRPYPTRSSNPSDPLGSSVPLCTAGRQADVLVRGYLTVFCGAGVPAQGGTVYVRYANPATGLPVGGLEATAIGGTNVAMTGVTFMGPADPQGNVEIRVNI